MRSPAVSVLMACRNGAEWLPAALASALDQDYAELEVVAVDDASEDATSQVLARAAQAYPGRVRFARNETQRGIPAVRTQCLAMAGGEYICLLDQDDLWLPGKVARQVAALTADPDVALVHTDYEAFDSATGAAIPWQVPGLDQEGRVLRELWVKGCFVMSGTVMVRRSAMAARGLGFWDLGLLSYDDYMLYLGLALDHPFAYLDDVLFRYRRHGGNLTEQLFAQNVHLRRIRLLRMFLERFPDAREQLGSARGEGFARHWLDAAAFEYAAGRPLSAGRCVLAAARWRPLTAAREAAGFADRRVLRRRAT